MKQKFIKFSGFLNICRISKTRFFPMQSRVYIALCLAKPLFFFFWVLALTMANIFSVPAFENQSWRFIAGPGLVQSRQFCKEVPPF